MSVPKLFALAQQHHQAGRLVEAERLYRQILERKPRHPDALHYLGFLAHQVGRHDAAVELIRGSIALRPVDSRAHNNLGGVLRAAGRMDEAVEAYRCAVALSPDSADIQYNLGNALDEAGRIDEAIASFGRVVALEPDFVEAHARLGDALSRKGSYGLAVASYRKAISLREDYAEAHANLARALTDAGQPAEAVAAFRDALRLRPDPRVHDDLIYAMMRDPRAGPRDIAAELESFNLQYAKPLESSIAPHRNVRDAQRRLRVGYVSSDFRGHVVGRNLLPFFRCHDHRRYEAFLYANGAGDSLTSEFQKLADRWLDVTRLTDEELASQVRADEIDILVDLSLHTSGNRLLAFARKPAPVQVSFAGYPGSTGLSAMDYRLSDPYLDPDDSPHGETILRLPDTFWCYDPLDCAGVEVNELPAASGAPVTFGCLNSFSKVNDDVLSLWAKVLQAVEGSRLLLLAGDELQRERVLHILDGARVEFVPPCPRREYLELHHRIDIGLDTFPYNGHTTSLDGYWMGVPIVTLAGSMPHARAGWSQLSNLGLTELAAQTPEQFVKLASSLAADVPRLRELRATLRGRMQRSPLMDAQRFARGIESAFDRMWRSWCTH